MIASYFGFTLEEVKSLTLGEYKVYRDVFIEQNKGQED